MRTDHNFILMLATHAEMNMKPRPQSMQVIPWMSEFDTYSLVLSFDEWNFTEEIHIDVEEDQHHHARSVYEAADKCHQRYLNFLEADHTVGDFTIPISEEMYNA